MLLLLHVILLLLLLILLVLLHVLLLLLLFVRLIRWCRIKGELARDLLLFSPLLCLLLLLLLLLEMPQLLLHCEGGLVATSRCTSTSATAAAAVSITGPIFTAVAIEGRVGGKMTLTMPLPSLLLLLGVLRWQHGEDLSLLRATLAIQVGSLLQAGVAEAAATVNAAANATAAATSLPATTAAAPYGVATVRG